MKAKLAPIVAALLFTACGTYQLGYVEAQHGQTRAQLQLDMLVCKDEAHNAANSADRQAGAFFLGMTIVGAPLAFELEKEKSREVYGNCMQARGYRYTPPTDGSVDARPAQEEYQKIQMLVHDAFQQAVACRRPINTNPRYARIYQHFGVGFQTPDADQLANKEKITDEEVGIGFDWYTEIQRCDTEMAQRMGTIDPTLGAMVVGFIRESTEIADDIVRAQPRPTIGSINKKILSLKSREKTQTEEWLQRIKARLQVDHSNNATTMRQNTEATDQATNLLKTGLQILAQRQAQIANAQQIYMCKGQDLI